MSSNPATASAPLSSAKIGFSLSKPPAATQNLPLRNKRSNPGSNFDDEDEDYRNNDERIHSSKQYISNLDEKSNQRYAGDFFFFQRA